MYCCWMITELHHLTVRSAIRPAVVQSSVCNSFADLRGNLVAANSFMSVGWPLHIELSDCCNWVDVNRYVGTAAKQNFSYRDNNLNWVFWWSLKMSADFFQTIIRLFVWRFRYLEWSKGLSKIPLIKCENLTMIQHINNNLQSRHLSTWLWH